jgi:hypothetical protein
MAEEEELVQFPEIEINDDMLPDDLRAVIHANMPGVTVCRAVAGSRRRGLELEVGKMRGRGEGTMRRGVELGVR